MFKFVALAILATFAAATDGSEFNGPEYIALSRKAKSDKIWAKVIANSKPGSWHLAGALLVD
jgi:hypothetical protein